jgi:hypothetical protein
MTWRAWATIPLFLALMAVPAFIIVAEIVVLGRHVELPAGVPGPLVSLAVLWGGLVCLRDVWYLIGKLDDTKALTE